MFIILTVHCKFKNLQLHFEKKNNILKILNYVVSTFTNIDFCAPKNKI